MKHPIFFLFIFFASVAVVTGDTKTWKLIPTGYLNIERNEDNYGGFSGIDISDDGFEMPVVHLDINYVKPLYHGDKVLLESWSLPAEGIRLPWKTNFINEKNICVAKASVHLVIVKRKGLAHRLIRTPPETLSKALLDLQRGK